MDKLTMAHEMALAIQKSKLIHDMELVSDMAWKYANAMHDAAEKQRQEDGKKKREEVREMLKTQTPLLSERVSILTI